MYFVKVVSASLLLAAIAALGSADPVARLDGGQDVDSLRQFPHHAYIIPYQSDRKCGGSILNNQWIITSAACVKHSARLEIHFGKKNEFDYDSGYYSISVNSDQVYVYPTNYDDLALVRLPMQLVFSDTISPISISSLSLESLRNRFTVMPGFNEKNNATDDNLKYGMFNVMDNSVCKQALGNGNFDEYTQVCTQGWGNSGNVPCDSDFGSGLIVGWPAKNELIGVFSMYSSSCNPSRPSVFTYVAKYLPWIQSMIQG